MVQIDAIFFMVGAEEVGGVVFWLDAEGERVLVAGLFLGGDELAMREPDEGVEPEEGFDEGGEEAGEGVVAF